MKLSMEVGVIAPMRCHEMINGVKLRLFPQNYEVIGIEEFFSDKVSVPRPASWPAGWLASQQKVPPSPGLIIISIIIVMIVKLIIIYSINAISFIHICNMNGINNNIVRI